MVMMIWPYRNSSVIVDLAMGQIPRSAEHISTFVMLLQPVGHDQIQRAYSTGMLRQLNGKGVFLLDDDTTSTSFFAIIPPHGEPASQSS